VFSNNFDKTPESPVFFFRSFGYNPKSIQEKTMNLSLVIPVYNEEENLPFLFEALFKMLSKLDFSWEVILVDDGSLDDSFSMLGKFAKQDPERIRVIGFRRNFGQTAAIAAGIDHAKGDVIALLDADMQNDPNDIPALLEKLGEGYDVVSGWRKRRKDPFLTRTLPSILANGIISWVTGVHLHDFGCTLKVYRREVLSGFRLYGEMHRFIPVYASAVGAKIIEVPVNHQPRLRGKANYGLERTAKVLLDLITVKFMISYLNKPIYLFGGTGLILISISGLTLLYLAIRRIFFLVSVLASPLFNTSVMFFVMGFLSVLMGLIAEMVIRTYHEAQGRKTYTIREKINF
jgi:glycosyltransferase involved in cell wall biosynthesis